MHLPGNICSLQLFLFHHFVWRSMVKPIMSAFKKLF
ncbi:hypothetical protein DAI22_08g030700 [Oryza sativa Japonica Group]|nr:hypothetical protein DAI22_08g030700 [Oryza sativa Japonica Group]